MEDGKGVQNLFGPALIRILSGLDWRDVANAAMVNKDWRKAASADQLWATLNLSGHQDGSTGLLKAAQSPQFRRHLRHINLEFAAGIEDTHLLELRDFNLLTINLNGCQNLSEGAIAKLISRMEGLLSLELYWVLSITDDTLMTASAYNTELKKLSLSGCKHITDQGLRLLAGTCHQLTHLNLTRCVQLTAKGLTPVCQQCSQLRQLYLYACSQIDDACMASIEHLNELKLISLCGAVKLTDAGLRSLANCRQLESVDLSWCIGLSDKGICNLALKCPRLKLLSLHGIRGITDKSMDALSESCQESLETLDVNGCVGIECSTQEQLLVKLPKLTCFLVHT